MVKKIKYERQGWLKNISGVKKLLVCILLTVVIYAVLLFF